MLVVLAFCSVLWHATNMPLAHYPDLWSMDSSISYLIIRVVFVGLQARMFPNRDASGPFISRVILTSCCLFAFSVVVIKLAMSKMDMYGRKVLHYGCPFSGRHRL